MIPKKLQDIYRGFDDCPACRARGNPLRHILGGGKFRRPRFLFLFVNPTHLNISSRPGYQGKRRYPFIGVRHFYRLLARAGFVSRRLVDEIYRRGWRTEDETAVEKSLADHGVYITNLVKCTEAHPDYPAAEVIEHCRARLFEEIDAVRPDHIVAFGRLAAKTISGREVRLADARRELARSGPLPSVPIAGRVYPVLPCFFPVGRGSPAKALEMLKYLRRRFGRLDAVRRREQHRSYAHP